jgi:DNA-binding response OmpR family regulator
MQLNKRRVLYVEDHEDTRELITIVLRQRNFEVSNARTVDGGVKLASEERFDLYLLDSWLPDGSGLDLCRRIRNFDLVTPILFYSAAAYQEDKSMALSAGAQAYLIKPSQTSELCDLVSSLIDKARQGASIELSSQ